MKIKRRTLHSVYVEADEYIGKLKWLKSDRAAKASLLVREKRGKKRKKRDCRELIVIVPASWQFLDKLEATREDLEGRTNWCLGKPVEVLGSPQLQRHTIRGRTGRCTPYLQVLLSKGSATAKDGRGEFEVGSSSS